MTANPLGRPVTFDHSSSAREQVRQYSSLHSTCPFLTEKNSRGLWFRNFCFLASSAVPSSVGDVEGRVEDSAAVVVVIVGAAGDAAAPALRLAQAMLQELLLLLAVVVRLPTLRECV